MVSGKQDHLRYTHENNPTEYVQVGDREVAVKVSGALFDAAATLLYESGSPGGRFSPLPREIVLNKLRVRVITYDRPGYGESDRQPGRTVASAAENVEQIVDALGIERFGIFGRSGGVSHALGAAAVLGDRITSVAGLVGLGPRDQMGFDNLEGMVAENAVKHELARIDFAALEAEYEVYAKEVGKNPAWFIDTFLAGQITEYDRRILEYPGVRKRLLASYKEALTPIQGTKGGGWADDTYAFSQPWGFNLSDVSQPVLLWHGEKDAFAPLSHAQWLADQIPQARLVVMPSGGHFDAIPAMLRSMAWQRDEALGLNDTDTQQ
jgi:pimeloyl-ACP methyl ester carboxylesterase